MTSHKYPFQALFVYFVELLAMKKNKPFSVALLAFFLSCLLSSCANIVAPTGGPRDEQPPRLDSLASTPNMQTNFKKQDILLAFDEWLKLQDVFNQVVVSPPLDYQPEVRLKKKNVIFEFDGREELRPDATYVINFGTAVRDLTEGNEVPNLRFVFSTGQYIDSLQLNGRVLDAVSGEPVEKILVMLYDNLADSVVRSVKPFYFARTDKQGNFSIGNLKKDTFKVFALSGLDYYYNNSKEQIGFLDTPIWLSDTTQPQLTIKLFAEQQALRLLKANTEQYGLLKLIFNADPQNVAISFADIDPPPITEYDRDTIKLWYGLADTAQWAVYVRTDSTNTDTTWVKPKGKAAFLADNRLKLSEPRILQRRSNIKPGQPISLAFSQPLTRFDTAKIRLLEDTLHTVVVPTIQIDSTNQRQLVIDYAWKPSMPYLLELQANAVTNLYGQRNDTLQLNYLAATPAQFGDLRLILEDLDSTQQYIVQLRDKGDQLIDQLSVSGLSVFQKEYKTLNPGQYQLHIIEDSNANGRWDSGNYDGRRQPERLLQKKLEELRADWEVEATVQVAGNLR